MEQFDFVPGLVYENEYLPVHWRLPKVVLYQPTQAVKTFAHIGGLAV
jgi:hypothetical protein